MFRVDFHNHCDCDPIDVLPYSALELIDRAANEKINAIAITPHGAVFNDPEAVEYAKKKGVLLIPGIEKMVEGREIVILNVQPSNVPRHLTFYDLTQLKEEMGESIFVFAPHPFYPRANCVGPLLDIFPELFDAVEYAHLYLTFYNEPNQRVLRWAKANNKPVLANSDGHALHMIGHNYTEVDAEELSAVALFKAIRQGKCIHRSRPHKAWELLYFIMYCIIYQALARTFKRRKL